jgi:RNA polymerase sigma-70 factor (ECF subfamily)
MLRLTRNVFLNMVQRERRLEPLHPDARIPSLGPNPEEEAMLRDVGLRVRRVMQSLTDRHREVLLLREVYGFAYAEIADHLEISLGSGWPARSWTAARARR